MQYKGHNITMYHKYQAICVNGKRILLHRAVAEDILGRPLKKTEVVHHKDHNRLNNNPDNLMVFKTAADHTAFHNGANIFKDGDVWVAKFKYNRLSTKSNNINPISICPVCKNTKSLRSKMCKKCNQERRIKNIPSKNELESLLKDNFNFSQIGRKYNVSSSAVKKWLKKYNLYEYQFYDLPEINNFLQIASSVNTIKELCAYYNCSSDTIYRFIRDLGLELQREQIVCETLQKTFSSATDAMKELFPNINNHNLPTEIRKAAIKNKEYRGYIWNIIPFKIIKKSA